MTNKAENAGNQANALEHAALSDVGLRRANNQDSYAVAVAGDHDDWQRRGHLFMVADGMGAHAAGELASKMACETIPHTYRKAIDRSAAHALHQAVLTANANIHERGQAHAEFQGMGTTCSVLVLMPRAALIAHIGDSRVYRLRGGTLEQLTFDHSLVWEMRAAGKLPGGDVFIPKNIITRSLGPHPDVQVDLEGPFPLEVGDAFLLCSDGLSGQVKDEEIGAVLGVLPPAEAVRVLVDLANLRGGPDNITAVVVRVASVPAAQEIAVEQAVEPEPGASVHPAVWGAMAVFLLAALGLYGADYRMAALVSGLLAAATVVVALVRSVTANSGGDTLPMDGPLGSGPYVTRDTAPNREAVVILCQMAQQLRDAAKDEHWTLDWSRFNTLAEQAQAALAAGDFAHAVRQYALAISFMMSEIRNQPARKDRRDSSVLDM